MFIYRYLCLLAHSGVQHILCCVFALYVFVLCTLCCQFLWTVHFWLPLRYSVTFILYTDQSFSLLSLLIPAFLTGVTCFDHVICIYSGILERFPYQIAFVSFNSNTTDATGGAAASYHSGAHDLMNGF